MVEVLFFGSAFLAEVIGTMAGFGSSTVFLPLALLFFDFKTALVLTAFLHIFGNINRIGFFRHGIDRRLVRLFGLPSVAATVLGAVLVPFIPQQILKTILGYFLVGYAGLSLAKETLKFGAAWENAVAGGLLSGFFAGLIGTGGALRGAFLTAFNLPKNKYIATAAAIALAVDVTRIPVYLKLGFLDSKYTAYLLPLFAVALAGSWVGKKMVDRIPQRIFMKLVLLAILAVGLKLALG